jgi:hypothetical protein
MTDEEFIKNITDAIAKGEGYDPEKYNYNSIPFDKLSNRIGPEALAEYMTGSNYIQSLKPVSATCSCGKMIIINPTFKYPRCPLCNTIAWPRKV